MKSDKLTESGPDCEVVVPYCEGGQEVISSRWWKVLILLGVIIYSSYTILLHLCEVDGKIPFKSSSMVLLIEVMKFLISVAMYIPEVKEKGRWDIPSVMGVSLFAVPATLYCITNNLDVFIQLEMDPATYQVLSNFKILTTAILFRIFIKRSISKIQWVALIILVLAGITNSIGGLFNMTGSHNAGQMHVTLKGLVMLTILCTLSGAAGVFTEYVLKRDKLMSLYLQNGLLYFFGMGFNGTLFLIQGFKSHDLTLLAGFSWHTWALIVTQAVIGLIMGAIMKHSSNITRLFLISTSMVLTTLLSILIFSLQINLYLVISTLMVLMALKLYYS